MKEIYLSLDQMNRTTGVKAAKMVNVVNVILYIVSMSASRAVNPAYNTCSYSLTANMQRTATQGTVR